MVTAGVAYVESQFCQPAERYNRLISFFLSVIITRCSFSGLYLPHVSCPDDWDFVLRLSAARTHVSHDFFRLECDKIKFNKELRTTHKPY